METIPPQINLLEEPLDVWNEVRKNPIGDEAIQMCDLTDVVRKYINWTNLLPRVTPFYGLMNLFILLYIFYLFTHLLKLSKPTIV